MKKLLPLLLLGVAAIFFSCESYEDNEGKLNLPEVAFETAQENLPSQGQISVKIVLDKAAEQNLNIPFTLLGNATEDRHFRFEGLPEGNTPEERHFITIPQGKKEATLTISHLQVNANPVQTQINLVRSLDDSYRLGNNKQMLVKLEERETVYVNFTQAYYETREFSSLTFDFTLTGAESGENYKAPEDFNLSLRVVPISTMITQPQITNVPESSYQFEEGSSVTIAEDSCKGTKTMRIRYIDQKLPSDPTANVPIFSRGDDWPAGYNFRFGLTFQNLPDGFALGDFCDTTYVYVKRIENPYDELLVGRKWINPKFWTDIEGDGASGRNLLQMIYNRIETTDYNTLEEIEFQKIMKKAEDDGVIKDPVEARTEARAIALAGSKKNAEARWNKLPTKANFNDGFIIRKSVGTGPELVPGAGKIDEYFFEILHELTVDPIPEKTGIPADSAKRPGFEKAYRDGLTRFNKYENMNMRYHPLGSGAPGIQLKVCGNTRFAWNEYNPKIVKHEEAAETTGISMFLIPSSSYGDKNESFIDIFLLGGNWDKGDSNDKNKFKKTNFFHDMYWFANDAGQYVYRDNRYYDIWFRFYRDTRVQPQP